MKRPETLVVKGLFCFHQHVKRSARHDDPAFSYTWTPNNFKGRSNFLFHQEIFPNPKWPDTHSAVKDDGKVLPYRWLGS
jgi:hypothetical protein